MPITGNSVFTGAGAKIPGNVAIGDNVKIGANAVVPRDIQYGRTAAGPAAPQSTVLP